MTKPCRDANPRWPGFLLAALVAVLATLFGVGTASAANATAAQTRVGAQTLVTHALVGPQRGIGAGQRLGNDHPAYDSALATGVAAETDGLGASSAYEDITTGGSIRNVSTDVTPDEFGTNLTKQGWTRAISKDGRATIYTNDGATYSVYPESGSTGGPTAQFTPRGADGPTLKIRLGS